MGGPGMSATAQLKGKCADKCCLQVELLFDFNTFTGVRFKLETCLG